ncbi:gamma carbonic anhydrase family protein [Enterococcus canis]|nr:gamma carbonic anhydrase family protein [Enterococcus canis]
MSYWQAENVDLIGDVTLGTDVNIWYQSVLRGDNAPITIGTATNIQDGTVIHVDEDAPVKIGDYVTVGHLCLLHGCRIENGALIGMGSLVMNHAVVEENAMVGAGSLVTEGQVIPAGMLAFGRPARVIRPLTAAEIAKNRANAEHYVVHAQKQLRQER